MKPPKCGNIEARLKLVHCIFYITHSAHEEACIWSRKWTTHQINTQATQSARVKMW